MTCLLLLLGIFGMEPPTPATQKLIYAAGYIPNIQFAPFYVAAQRGYYTEEGVDLEMDYTMGPDVFKLVALGKVHMGSADPDAFLQATERGLPLVHVATLYQNYPLALIAREDLFSRHDLRGKRIGISGTYGSSYLGLKAMLSQIGLELSDVRVASIGFTQSMALSQERVDVIVGYINNEPLRLAIQGVKTTTYTLDGSNRIPGVGLMTSTKYFKNHRPLVEAFLRATFKGMNDVIQDPKTCFDLVVENYLPELSNSPRMATEYQVLLATIPFWKSAYTEANGYGQCSEEQWQNLVAQMKKDSKSNILKEWEKYLVRDFTFKPNN